ncbi:putative small auxin-up RNA [Helianthus annuus]|uniref:Small auxin-up RNA n=1 Tax=Helianthus annuus TaxID=4232 RepID=A0A251S362_HELAN|nr:putative small auxin-up RNA [Helianthus annuus]KAJ0489918.1 putative small auxin-up RNA [Helianthus annuus]KAJ0493949.1 putative small auxin-up RNA [Helianthus annuus]KAJ0675501.1 putative small auxin-up RNA [Helianthus annuus]KAJ0678790.1 putative small auxin-up RNA [Helianthus annuus]
MFGLPYNVGEPITLFCPLVLFLYSSKAFVMTIIKFNDVSYINKYPSPSIKSKQIKHRAFSLCILQTLLISSSQHINNMISAKKLIRTATLRQKGITSRKIDKGHFAVYTSDETRFVMPLSYLKNDIFQKVLMVAGDEYGSQPDGPIRLPFEATFMKYIISLIERCVCNHLQKELLTSIITSEMCSSIQVEQNHHQVPISSF